MNKNSFKAGKYIIINILTRTLNLYQGSHPVRTYNIAVGKPATPTPTGQYKIVSKIINPKGSLGTRWLSLSVSGGHYGIHGTNDTLSIGKSTSNGNIRMYLKDVEQLFSLVNIGTPVLIVAEPEKTMPTQTTAAEKKDYAVDKINSHNSEALEEKVINDALAAPLEQIEPEPDPLGFYYQVIAGDTIWTIAQRFRLPVQLLINHNLLINPHGIYPGQKIFIPKQREL